MAGLAAAKAQGRTGGRSHRDGRGQAGGGQGAPARGKRSAKIANALSVSRAWIYRHLAR